MKHVDLDPWWQLFKPLLTQHGFLTVIFALLAVSLTLRFYRLLKSINPALVGFVLLLIVFLLVLNWSQTRNEPAFLKPAMDWLVRYIPSSAPVYQH